jgi:hypothetical protein
VRLRSTVDQWVDADRSVLGHNSKLTRVGPPATPGHESSLVGAEKREGSTGVLLRASLELGWRCGDRAMAMKQWWWRSSAMVSLKLGRKGKRGEEGAVRNGGGHLLLYGPGECRGGGDGR